MNADWLSKGRIPSLDGLRGVSILLVTICHIPEIAGVVLPEQVATLFKRGDLGVDAFFVISGFLITHLLLREHEKHGTISLPAFYLRRTLRIFPAYYFFLFAMSLLCFAGFYNVTFDMWLRALTYTENFATGGSHATGHLWSLAVEEQFYLVWPLTVVMLSPRRAIWGAALALATAPVVRFYAWEQGRSVVDIDIFLLTRMDTLAVGCILAFVIHTPAVTRYARAVQRYSTVLAIACAAGVFLSDHFLAESGKYTLGPKRAIEAFLLAHIVMLAVMHPGSVLGRVLNCAPLAYIGAISYSLYLAQALLTFEKEMPVWVNIVGPLCFAFITHYLVEKPFLKLKERLPRPKPMCDAQVTAA
jgi:peptidoglycan/LPS O-acetylase OafA/YrhL